jgi:hypothetical protein
LLAVLAEAEMCLAAVVLEGIAHPFLEKVLAVAQARKVNWF